VESVVSVNVATRPLNCWPAVALKLVPLAFVMAASEGPTPTEKAAATAAAARTRARALRMGEP
jgi:hypothetical protein